MNNLFTAFIWLIFIPIVLTAQKLDCRRFKNGLFRTKSEISGLIIISRHGNFQTETSATGIRMDFSVTWLNNCNYTLKPTAGTRARYKLPANALLTVTITKVKVKSYFQVSSSNLTGRKAGSEIVKIGN